MIHCQTSCDDCGRKVDHGDDRRLGWVDLQANTSIAIKGQDTGSYRERLGSIDLCPDCWGRFCEGLKIKP